MRSGRKISSRNVILFFQKSENPFHRLGIVVKKEIGPAAFRNKIRRYVREFFRLHKHQIKGSYDIILMIKKGCSINRYQQAEEELRRLFILWERERPTSLPKKDLSFSFISIGIRFPLSLGLAVVLLLPAPLMLCYRFNDLGSWRDPCCHLRDLSNAIHSIPAETIPFPKSSKNLRKET